MSDCVCVLVLLYNNNFNFLAFSRDDAHIKKQLHMRFSSLIFHSILRRGRSCGWRSMKAQTNNLTASAKDRIQAHVLVVHTWLGHLLNFSAYHLFPSCFTFTSVLIMCAQSYSFFKYDYLTTVCCCYWGKQHIYLIL